MSNPATNYPSPMWTQTARPASSNNWDLNLMAVQRKYCNSKFESRRIRRIAAEHQQVCVIVFAVTFVDKCYSKKIISNIGHKSRPASNNLGTQSCILTIGADVFVPHDSSACGTISSIIAFWTFPTNWFKKKGLGGNIRKSIWGMAPSPIARGRKIVTWKG